MLGLLCIYVPCSAWSFLGGRVVVGSSVWGFVSVGSVPDNSLSKLSPSSISEASTLMIVFSWSSSLSLILLDS